jgi:hypothetical protein
LLGGIPESARTETSFWGRADNHDSLGWERRELHSAIKCFLFLMYVLAVKSEASNPPSRKEKKIALQHYRRAVKWQEMHLCSPILTVDWIAMWQLPRSWFE